MRNGECSLKESGSHPHSGAKVQTPFMVPPLLLNRTRLQQDFHNISFAGISCQRKGGTAPFVQGFQVGTPFKDRCRQFTEGHFLIITPRHTPDYFTLTSTERRDSEVLARILRNKIASKDEAVTGFNIGANCGKSAGQTIWHAHVHLIPRRDGGALRRHKWLSPCCREKPLSVDN